jgi:hypothetical protein
MPLFLDPPAPMANYEIARYTLEPVDGDDQIALTIHATDGSKWEYGIPYNRATGRYTFEEIDVLEMDFGDEFTEPLRKEIEALVAKVRKK